MAMLATNQTSASMLLEYGRKRWGDDAGADHLALLSDLYIKAWSYALFQTRSRSCSRWSPGWRC